MLLDDIFDMGGGYVLNFSERTFAQFFAEELNIDIDDPVYARNGSSKATRRRWFSVQNATYLVEAKWHGKPLDVVELHTFHEK